MALDIPNYHWQVAFHHTGYDVTGEMINTLGVDATQAQALGQQGILDAISNTWSAGPQAQHSTGVVYVKATAMARSGGGILQAWESVAGSIAGSGSAPPHPLNVTMIVEKRTGIAGRKFRGRMHFGGFPQGTTGAGNVNEIDTSALASFQSAFNAFRASLVGQDMLPVILHPVGGPPPTLITSFVVKALVGNMRKRIR